MRKFTGAQFIFSEFRMDLTGGLSRILPLFCHFISNWNSVFGLINLIFVTTLDRNPSHCFLCHQTTIIGSIRSNWVICHMYQCQLFESIQCALISIEWVVESMSDWRASRVANIKQFHWILRASKLSVETFIKSLFQVHYYLTCSTDTDTHFKRSI